MRALLVLIVCAAAARAAAVETQPFLAALGPLLDATELLGSPFSPAEKAALEECRHSHTEVDVREACGLLDKHCLFVVNISPEQRVKVAPGDAKPELDEGGWRQFLVRVDNEAGTTAKLRCTSPFAQPVYAHPWAKQGTVPAVTDPPALAARWLDLQMFEAAPMRATLSGLETEYRIIELYSKEPGKREASFAFDVGQGTQDLGFRSEASVLFQCRPARQVVLRLKDEHGQPCTASLEIRDAAGRVYPSQAKRLAPDLFFQTQVYRADGDVLNLPDGTYDVTFHRGPESRLVKRQVKVSAETHELAFQVDRWIDPSLLGWWSGDHHIHAAGCAHYVVPSEGVLAADMSRQCQGEDLKVGANLTWGPCFDYQKQFFTGKEDKVSQYPYLLRYDVEVSGFGSHRSGHLCLLKLKEQMYPGGDSTAHWPTLCLNTLKWAKKQGAVCGPAHSGWGLQPLAEDDPARARPYKNWGLTSVTEDLPNDVIPPFNGIGANEYIVDVTHDVEGPEGKPVPAVDFISLGDTPHVWELNIWYHALNAGFRTRASGETDFPCVYQERVGLGRSYVKLADHLSYDAWCEGVRAGRNYVSDGRSHLMDFKANNQLVGENGSEIRLPQSGNITLTAHVAALLDEQPHPEIQNVANDHKPYWSIERARIGTTRQVPVEVIVNGVSTMKKSITADGSQQDLTFDLPVKQSCWVALRIRASSHTNPIFVTVANKPVRVKKSLEWCLKSVDQCWSQKEPLIDEREHADAVAAYDHARQVYKARLAEANE